MAQKIPTVLTPKSKAVWPKLTEPDDFKGKKEYKVSIELDPSNEDHAAFIEKVENAAEEAYDNWVAETEAELKDAPGAKKAKLKKQLASVKKHVPLTEQADDEGDPTGRMLFATKMLAEGVSKAGKAWSRKCPLFDSRGKDVTGKAPSIWGGSTLILEVTLNPFAMPATERAGVSGRLEAVQIIELASGGGGGSKFGVEEGGYCAEDDEEVTSRFDDIDDDEEEDF
ncbi:MAG: hypothetical protein MJH10_13255 [Epibacterium sp.]|nr:hypothetical protein [Epibacterium sp.]NQX74508.1 hypothetical protein [Epibacterium sp.]